ncbi:la-related protein 6-like [Heterodontus francisci]|uniref:la-related protein 6-like n=1 Tax=Heterodontus francisci TaxID=7792 RepID=UPI00355B775D
MKGFDRVNKGKLFLVVEGLIIRGYRFKVIDKGNKLEMRCFLRDRKQRVLVDRCFCEWKVVSSGITQGSVLDPLLFLVYINDLNFNVGCMIGKFAADTKICRVVDSEAYSCRVQNNINSLVEWSEKWQMEFNPEMCESVAMSSSDSPASQLGSPASRSSPVQVRGEGRPLRFRKRIGSEDAEEFQSNSDQQNSFDLSETNDDCLEYNEWIPPNSDTIQKIISQVEFYLSDENLAVDSFLLKHMKRNKMGYISIKLLTSFKKVKCLTKDWKVTAYALNCSKLLEINQEGTKIRRKNPVPEFLLSVPPSKRILAWNLYNDSPENNGEISGQINTMETAMKVFAIHGPISSIRILQPGKDIPAELKKYMLKYPEVGTKVCVLVEYECYEGAKKAYEELGKKPCHNDENLKVVILTGKGTKKINGIDADESEDFKKSNPKKPSRQPTKIEQLQYTVEESVYSSSESDGANSPASVQRYLQHKICDAYNCNSQMPSPSTASWSQSWSDHHCSPCVPRRSLVYHHPSPLTDFVGQGFWPSPSTSPEFTKKFYDYSSDSGNCSGSPWVQRRRLAASQAASLEINQATCKQSVRKHQSSTGLPPGLVRLPFGPDGTKGFHNSIGRGRIVLRH